MCVVGSLIFCDQGMSIRCPNPTAGLMDDIYVRSQMRRVGCDGVRGREGGLVDGYGWTICLILSGRRLERRRKE